jgi:hypothetical protein
MTPIPALSASADSLSLPQGRSVATGVSVLPRSGFKGSVSLTVSDALGLVSRTEAVHLSP